MNDRIFLDTNTLIYLYSADEKDKQEKVQNIIDKNKTIISTQVLSEISNVMTRKMKVDPAIVENVIDEISSACEVVTVEAHTIKLALRIAERYKYSYFDSLILSSAVENGCTIVFSEDMQNGQLIENMLKIINPFLKDEER